MRLTIKGGLQSRAANNRVNTVSVVWCILQKEKKIVHLTGAIRCAANKKKLQVHDSCKHCVDASWNST